MVHVHHVDDAHELGELVLDALVELAIAELFLLDLDLLGEQAHLRDFAQQGQRFETDVGVAVGRLFHQLGHRVAPKLLGLLDELPVVGREHSCQVPYSLRGLELDQGGLLLERVGLCGQRAERLPGVGLLQVGDHLVIGRGAQLFQPAAGGHLRRQDFVRPGFLKRGQGSGRCGVRVELHQVVEHLREGLVTSMRGMYTIS